MAKNWREVRATAVARGLDEQGVADAREQLEDRIRAHRLAEVRKDQHVTQAEIAQRLGVGQPRISQIEHGDLNRTELATLRAYVEALGGELEISATFDEQRIRIA
jgi:DNA-binding XRE family transcriptional regulator